MERKVGSGSRPAVHQKAARRGRCAWPLGRAGAALPQRLEAEAVHLQLERVGVVAVDGQRPRELERRAGAQLGRCKGGGQRSMGWYEDRLAWGETRRQRGSFYEAAAAAACGVSKGAPHRGAGAEKSLRERALTSVESPRAMRRSSNSMPVGLRWTPVPMSLSILERGVGVG